MPLYMIRAECYVDEVIECRSFEEAELNAFEMGKESLNTWAEEWCGECDCAKDECCCTEVE